MAKYRFEQIAINCKEKKKPTEEDRFTYIGLEHLDTGSLNVTRFGSDVAPIGEKLIMRKGDVLFGKRRAYQKKVAVAPFDGIFSAHGMVLRPKEDVVDKNFFPLFISSDYFLDAAIKISVGSLSPTINWRDLKDLEFEMPDLHTQKKLAEVLWAINNAIESYKKLISATDELVKSQFIEMFGNLLTNDKMWPEYKLGDISTSRLGKMLDSKKQTGKYLHPYLANVNVQWFRFDLENLNLMDFDEVAQSEFELRPRDLLVCEGGEIGRCAIWTGELQDCYYQKAIHRVRCNESIIIPEYLAHLFYYHSQINGFSDVVGNKVTIAHLPGDKLKAMRIMVPPLLLQEQFAAFVRQSDKSKFAVLSCLKHRLPLRFQDLETIRYLIDPSGRREFSQQLSQENYNG